MKKAIKILYFVDRMGPGGIQNLIVNIVSIMNKAVVEIDVLVLDDGKKYPLENKLSEMGIRVYKLKNIWINRPIDYVTYCKAINNFFSMHREYDIVHLHGSSKNFFVLRYAKKYGVKHRLVHSHNTDFQVRSRYKVFVGNILKFPLKYYATGYIACSELASSWLFGKDNLDVKILKNAIPLKKFKYSSEKRTEIRKELELKDQIAIVNVGRFYAQKNHVFLIEIFQKLYANNKNMKLFLIGEGDLLQDTKQQVRACGLEDAIVFLGYRKDVNDLLQAMDLFLMPSFHEGFPVVAVEAQASGLPCLFSDTITKEVKIIDEVSFVSLDETVGKWSDEALDLVSKSNREKSERILKKNGFDIVDVVAQLEQYYTKLV